MRAGIFPWLAALALSALAPAFLIAGLDGETLRLLPEATAFALAHALLLGLPAAMLFYHLKWTGVAAVLAAAFFIGALPLSILTYPPVDSQSHIAGSAPLVVDGVATWAGWLKVMQFAGLFGALGALGGLVFWLTLRLCGTIGQGPVRRLLGLGLASVGVLTMVAVLASLQIR